MLYVREQLKMVMKLNLKQRTRYARFFVKKFKDDDMILRDGSMPLPPNQFIDLLNDGAEHLSCTKTVLPEGAQYHYRARYRRRAIQTITKNKIYCIQ